MAAKLQYRYRDTEQDAWSTWGTCTNLQKSFNFVATSADCQLEVRIKPKKERS